MVENVGHGWRDYLEALDRLGSGAAVAREFGVNKSTVNKSIRLAREKGLHLSEGAQDSINRAGLDGMIARGGHRRVYDEDGKQIDTLRYELPKFQEDPEQAAERVRGVLEGMDAARVIPAPQHSDADLCTLYPIADVHIGMMAWGKETGEAYSTDIASDRLRSWVGQCIASSPASQTAIILDAGDLTHADDQTNQTPASKHVLDVDTRHFRTLDVTVQALAFAVELALEKHANVIVRILPGNHNPHSYLVVLFALAERFRENPRVRVQKVPGEFFAHEFGKVMIAAHHGDKAKADRIVHFLADQFAEMWGRTKHRFLFTGHLHHHKSQDIGGVQWEQLRAVTAKDAYAASHAYGARAQLQAITFHRERGEVSRVKVSS